MIGSSPDIYVTGGPGDGPTVVDEPPPKPVKPPGSGGNVFLKCAGGGSFYVSRAALLRSHRLKQLLVEAEARQVISGGEKGKMLEIEVGDVRQEQLVKLMEHLERSAKAEDPARNEADTALVEGLELEELLRMTGAAHRLGVQAILALGAERIARELRAACASPPGERASIAMDVYTRPDPSDALSDADAYAARTEFIFTQSDAPAAFAAPPNEFTSSVSSPLRPVTYGRYTGGCASVPSMHDEAMGAAEAAGAQGVMGTGGAGDAGVPKGLASAGADALVKLIGGEAPLLAVLTRLDAPCLSTLKGFGTRWRRRARTALCSGEWAEGARSGESLDLGDTRDWLPEQRVTVARFLSDGRFSQLKEMRADGFAAELTPLAERASVDAFALVQALTVNPSADKLADADALAAQSEFCSLIALWLLATSQALEAADLSALCYSGLLPLRDALAPAVELATRRRLTSLTVDKCALPVRDLVGAPPPPQHARSSAPSRPAPANTVELKWQRLGALDATLIAALLRANRTITRLDLSWNAGFSMAGSSGSRDLADAVGMSRTLTDINLSETSLGAGCADALGRAVRSNASLTRLNLKSSGLEREGRDELERVNAARASPLELLL